MFRHLWSGLPKDPHFPSDLKELGYFVNEKDEIRNIEKPEYYFKYFHPRNERHNERQRFAMNEACEELVHSRLAALGLDKVVVPFFADCIPDKASTNLDFLRGNAQFQHFIQVVRQDPSILEPTLLQLDACNPQLGRTICANREQFNKFLLKNVDDDAALLSGVQALSVTEERGKHEAHLPIFVSKDCYKKSRVVIIIGEAYQDLGILAHRVLGGPGGVDEGSLVSVVKLLQQQRCSASDPSPPGVVIANTGQTIWSPELKRALTIVGSEGAPMPSAVHAGMYIDQTKNRIKYNRTASEHIRYIFETVRGFYIDPEAGMDIIAIGDGADMTEKYLNDQQTWERLGKNINCFAILGGFYNASELKCEGFRKFMREKAQAWTTSSDPLGTMISGPDGNPETATFTSLGCPVFSGGEEYYVECILVRAKTAVCAFLQHVALVGKDYANMEIEVDYKDPELPAALQEPDWSSFKAMSEEEIDRSWKEEVREAGAKTAAPVMNERLEKEAAGVREKKPWEMTVEEAIKTIMETPDSELYD